LFDGIHLIGHLVVAAHKFIFAVGHVLQVHKKLVGNVSPGAVHPHPKFHIPAEVVGISLTVGYVIHAHLASGIGSGSFQVHRRIGLAARGRKLGVKRPGISLGWPKFPFLSEKYIVHKLVVETGAALNPVAPTIF